jgi:hypothetical protein
MKRCWAKIRGRICERNISPSRPDDLLCSIHWMAKYGHTWQPMSQHVYAEPRICARCGAREDRNGQLSFKLCTNPRNPHMEFYADYDVKEKSGPKLSPTGTAAEQILYWIARARIAERELERRYYDSLENV